MCVFGRVEGEKMLQNLHVRNLALIDETEVEFSEGLNILSGEKVYSALPSVDMM